MRNIIKADLYRIFRGMGVYIAFTVLLIVIIAQVAEAGIIGIAIGPVYDGYMTGRNAPILIASYSDNLVYFLLAFIVFITSADFKNGAVKNLLSCGVSRTKYYFAKLVLVAVVSAVLMLFFFVTAIVTATIFNGFGESVDAEYFITIAEIYLPQLYLLFAFGCVGTFLIFTIKNTAALNTIYIAFTIVPMMVLSMASTVDRTLIDYDLIFNMKWFAIDKVYPIVGIESLNPPATNLPRALILGGAWILTSTVGGILLFKKAEIK
jgi:ABC-2 type transport system permease protein